MKRNCIIGIISALFLLWSGTALGQKVAVKTNLLYDATATANLGVEVGLAPKWTLDLSGNLNAWTIKEGKRWKQWMVQPEARYWTCERFSGHFFALHALGGQFNFGGIPLFGLKDTRKQGWMAGAGLGYGYSWILSRHVNLELELGVGYVHSRYDQFECEGCGRKIAENQKGHYFGPTKAALNLVFAF